MTDGERFDEKTAGGEQHDSHAPHGETGPARESVASKLARRRWSLVAGACVVAAAVLWPLFGVDAAFVAAALGVVAWFLDQRARLRPLLPEPADDTDESEDETLDEGEDFDADEEFDEGEESDAAENFDDGKRIGRRDDR